jgi:hypothetical protein
MVLARSVRPATRSFLGALCVSLLALAVAAPARAEAPSHPFLFRFFASPEIEGREPGHRYPAPQEGLEGACGVAVDSHGYIYVADYYHDAVDIFQLSKGLPEYLTQIRGRDAGNGPCGLAVGSGGTVYVNNWHQNVVKFVPSEFPLQQNTPYGPGTVIDSARSTGVAIDPASGNVYVDDRTYVAEYEPSGVPVLSGKDPLQIGLGTLGKGYGVAVSDFPATEGYVYVADAADNTVKVYKPSSDPVNPISVIDGAGTPQAGFNSLIDSSIAVDQSNGHAYVADNLLEPFEHPAAVVDEFNSAGAYRGQISSVPALGSGKPPQAMVHGEPSGLAVDGAGNVYVTSGNSESAVLYGFGPAEPAHTLEIAKSGTGKGTVTSKPAGIDCGKACIAEFNSGEAVTLTATPDSHSAFSGWTVNGNPNTCLGTGTCQVNLDANTEVSASFVAIPQKTLSVSKSGAGSGTVTSQPAGIDCGAACAVEFNKGSVVTLTATPDPHSAFVGWSGCGGESSGECTVTMSVDRSVDAEFEAIPGGMLGVQEIGAAKGGTSAVSASVTNATPLDPAAPPRHAKKNQRRARHPYKGRGTRTKGRGL